MARQAAEGMHFDGEDMLILASQSASRKAMLCAGGVPFEARGSDVDEAEIKRDLIGVPVCEIAQILAEAQATAVPVVAPGRLVRGCPSLAEVLWRALAKPATRE